MAVYIVAILTLLQYNIDIDIAKMWYLKYQYSLYYMNNTDIIFINNRGKKWKLYRGM